MSQPIKLSASALLKSIVACTDNADRLLEETYDLEFRTPSATRMYIAQIAQEECAKGFILYLVREGVMPYTQAVRRAIKDHAAKQLVGVLMDYIIMHWDEIEELDRAIHLEVGLGSRLPNDVGSAVELLCYEKIGRWSGNNYIWVEDPAYDRLVEKISEGHKDRRKQDALYVRVGKTGQVASTPSVISDEETTRELELARRYWRFVVDLAEGNGKGDSSRFEKVVNALRTLLGTHSGE
jgi:hypothetical protein